MQIKQFFQLISTGIIFALSLVSIPSATAQSSLETELLNVMRGKAMAFHAEADIDAWQKYWIQDAHSSRSSIDKFEYIRKVGWEDLIAQAKKSSQERGKVDGLLMTFDNVRIRTSGNMAFLEVDEHWRLQDNDTLVTNIHTYAVFMQENKDGK